MAPTPSGTPTSGWLQRDIERASKRASEMDEMSDSKRIATLRADRDRLREALKVAQPAITQAMDCIRGETPEDCSPGEAEDSTFSKLRDADAAIDEALQSSTGAA